MGNNSSGVMGHSRSHKAHERDNNEKDDTKIRVKYCGIFHKLDVTRRTRTTIIAILMTVVLYTCSLAVLFTVGPPGYVGVAILSGLIVVVIFSKSIIDWRLYSNYKKLTSLTFGDNTRLTLKQLTKLYDMATTSTPEGLHDKIRRFHKDRADYYNKSAHH